MFEKEYITHKLILLFAMIGILIFTVRYYLPQKHGISVQEGESLAIANASVELSTSPYDCVVYNNKVISTEICKRSNAFALYQYNSYLAEIRDNVDHNSILVKPKQYTNITWNTNNYYNNLFNVSSNYRFSYKNVMNHCTQTQNAPLYYILLHTVCSIFGSLNLYHLPYHLNAIFLMLSAFLIIKIGKKYFHTSWVGFCAALVFLLCLGTISASMTATPYIMTSLIILCTMDLHFLALSSEKTPFYVYICLVLINTIGNLTDYTYILFEIILIFCFVFAMLNLGRGKELPYYALSGLFTFPITALIFPASYLHIGTYIFKAWNRFIYHFSFVKFGDTCTLQLGTVLVQLFGSFSIIYIMLLIILCISALFLKKESFSSYRMQFKERASEGDMIDAFMVPLTLLYFIGLCYFGTGDSYVLLTTMLPLTSLLFVYIIFRLTKTSIKSEFNSGLLITLFCLVICGFSLFINQPNYSYTEQKAQTDFAKKHKNESCIYLASDQLQAYNHMLELSIYRHSIVLAADNLDFLKTNESFLEAPSILLYLSSEDYIEGVMEDVAHYGNFAVSNEIAKYEDEEHNDIYIYELIGHTAQ